jgi:hypothetical protein
VDLCGHLAVDFPSAAAGNRLRAGRACVGGPKRVRRISEGSDSPWIDIPSEALTIVPSGAQYRWHTLGPVDSAHLYVDPDRLNHAIEADFDRDHSEVKLTEAVGVTDPLLSELIKTMLEEVATGAPDHGAYFDRLLDMAVVQLALHHSTMRSATTHARHALAPRRLRQVLSYVEAHISEPIQLDDLAQVAKLSRYHFSRAFQNVVRTASAAQVRRPMFLTSIGRWAWFASELEPLLSALGPYAPQPVRGIAHNPPRLSR